MTNISRWLCCAALLLPLACGSSDGDDDDSNGSGGSGAASGGGGGSGAGRGGAAARQRRWTQLRDDWWRRRHPRGRRRRFRRLFGLNEVNDVRSVVRSEDDGASFQVLANEMLGSIDDLFVRGTETLYAVAGGRVARSGDGGESFEFLTEATPALELYPPRLLVDEYETLYLFTDRELWQRHAGDTRWYASGLPSTPNDVLMLPDDTLVYATETALMRSTSYGDEACFA